MTLETSLNQEQFHKIVDVLTRSSWEVWLPSILQIVGLALTLFTLFLVNRENSIARYHPIMIKLHEELDDLVLSLYNVFSNPAFGQNSNELAQKNFEKSLENFISGHRAFVRSSILTDRNDIEKRIKNSGRRVMYFNLFKNNYVTTYVTLIKVLQKAGMSEPFNDYYKLAKFDEIYEAYKDMQDIER